VGEHRNGPEMSRTPIGHHLAAIRPHAVPTWSVALTPILAAVLIAGCSGVHTSTRALPPAVSTPSTSGPTTVVPTTTTATSTVLIGPVYPLTGLPVTDEATAERAALSVKIDNAPSARPQSGLNDADIVTEELVEGGLTRFMATFQSHDTAQVGPIRSARPVDADLLAELGGGIFAYSGAAAGEIAPVEDHSGAVLLSFDSGNPAFHRSDDRPAPSNVYAATTDLYAQGQLRATATGVTLAPPPELFTYQTGPPAGGQAGATVTLPFSGASPCAWTWNPATRLYQRSQNGIGATLADGTPITTNNIVVLEVAITGTDITDASGHEDPFVVVTGSGSAWLLRDGVRYAGDWSRALYTDQLQLSSADGAPLLLTPGRTWIELLPDWGQPTFG
jgi:hypothetical protein